MVKAIDWKAAVWAGVIAGLVFMVLEMFLVQFFGEGTMWGAAPHDRRDCHGPRRPPAACHF